MTAECEAGCHCSTCLGRDGRFPTLAEEGFCCGGCLKVAKAVKAWADARVADLVGSEEGVLEKPTTPGEKEQATWKMNKGGHAEEASVGLPEWQRWPGVFGARDGWQLEAAAYSIYNYSSINKIPGVRYQGKNLIAHRSSREATSEPMTSFLSLLPQSKRAKNLPKAVPTTFYICL